MEHISETLDKLPKRSMVSVLPSGDGGKVRCKLCNDAGFVYPHNGEGGTDYSRVVPCQCKKKELIQQQSIIRLKHCHLPEATEKMTFKGFRVDKITEKAYKAAEQIANEDGLKWLTLVGSVDLGKTHLAVAICRRWLERGKSARYAYVPLLLDELRAGFELRGDHSYRAKFDYFCNVPLLVLDDLGVERATGFARENLNTIIDYRYMHALPLVVTLNTSLGQIPGDEEHRIASRLQRFPGGKVVALDGQEYRLRQRGKK